MNACANCGHADTYHNEFTGCWHDVGETDICACASFRTSLVDASELPNGYPEEDFMPVLKTTSDRIQFPSLLGDCGYNLPSAVDVHIWPGTSRDVRTGICVEMPPGYFGLILPRSRVNLEGKLHISVGVIDNGWRGELMVFARNICDRVVVVNAGESLAQLVMFPLCVFPIKIVSELSPSERGTRGFGSTGR